MMDPSQRVAIVGIGGVFPGAPDLERFWALVASGRDATRDVPPGRWLLDPSDAFDPRVAAPDRVYSTRGGFVEEFRFDPEGLDLDPGLVDRLDPMFRLALQAGRAAWRDGRTDELARSRVGVVFGNIVLPIEAASALARETLGRTLAERALGGRAGSLESQWGDEPLTHPINRFAAGLPAGLLARALGLGGGAYTLDAACASSLYALKLAADELLAGRADAMLTGGLSRPDPLYTQMGFSQLRALSASGRARPFDGRGDGLVVGEGAGMFLLKRLDDALRQGDHVYGTAAAVGLSNDVDGGLLAPSSEGQLRAMRAAYDRAGWDPRDVDLIECHATGTPVGDAVELESLKALWGKTDGPAGRCVIGSHKANIGHALTASGAAGLLKVLLALKHKVLPPTANFEAPGSHPGLDASPFRVLSEAEPWEPRADGRPRRAAVSGFGFGGINAHALIEEWVPEQSVSPAGDGPADVVPIAIVGLGAHFGPFRGLRAVQERLLGGTGTGMADAPEPAPAATDWGVFASSWARREGLGDESARGYHLESLSVPPDRFRIPPRELEEMLPQQTLALLAAADAIGDAGWRCDRPRLRAGVFFGIGLDPNTTNFHVRWSAEGMARAWDRDLGLNLDEDDRRRWAEALRDAAGPPLTANRTMGALGGLIASRVAREFRLGGPSFTVSSEETSGLRAVEVAVRSLRLGELDEAVAGAVDQTGDPRVAEAARRAGIDGLVRGDGAAALVLKRLDDAERDGDRVYAVIRGIGAASGAAIDAPETDRDVIDEAGRRCHSEACLEPVEGEFTDVVASERASAGVACEVGHAGAAAGLAGLVRAVLGLYQQVLPPPPDEADVGPRFWLRDRKDGPRRATVVGSGVDGGCVQVVLDEYEGVQPAITTVERVQPVGARTQALFAVEADDLAGLIERLDQLDGLASADPSRPIEALARRWWAEFPNEPKRALGLAVVARSPDDLRERLIEARRLAGSPSSDSRPGITDRVFFSPRPLGPGAPLAMVFPGIGNHFAGMGRALSAHWPEVFRALDAETLRLRTQLAPGAGWDSADVPAFADHRAPILAQVVTGTAVTDLLRTFGVVPDAVIGYSLGESSALFATRAWADRDAMHDSLDASPLFRTELCGPCDAAQHAWGLAPGEPADWAAGIVPYPAEAVRKTIREHGIPRAYLLIINTPTECVIGGDRRSVQRLAEALGGLFVPLPVVSTVHCEVAREVEGAYRDLHRLETHPPAGVRFYSAGWGRAYVPDRDTAAEAIVAQAVATVDFPAVIRRAYDDGVRVFVEAGPGASCSRMIAATLGDRPHLARPACPAAGDALGALLGLLGRLIAERVPVDLKPLYGSETRAVGLDPFSETDRRTAPPARAVTIPVGGRPFDVPPIPVGRSPHTTPALNGHEAPPNVTPPQSDTPLELSPVALTAAVISDDLARQVFATEAARGGAHDAFLRSSESLGQTLANHTAFQMALVEALMATPAATEAPATGQSPSMTATLPDPEPRLDREACLEFAVGSIGKVLGPGFAAIDAHPTRVRLPDEPLMLVDRVVTIEGEPLSMSSGRVVTEHDVSPDAWYLDGGKTPPCIAIESGQADLFLSAWLGVDFETQGRAVYRLLDAAVTFYRGLPEPGDVVRYDIRISKFFRQGDTHLFRFHFDATVGGEPLLSMRDGCAGFFTEAELSAGQGVVRRPLDLRAMPGKRPDDWEELVPTAVEAYDDRQVDALRRGDYASAFGPAFEGLGMADPLRLPGGRMTLVHRVPHLDPTGGRFGLGLIRSELDIHSGDWFLACHFVDDRVMPGTLMYECCLHTLRIFLLRLGWVAESDGVAYEPVPGVSSRLRCRGQVVESTGKAVFEVVVKELGYGPEPYAIADAMMYADGKAIVEVADMTLRMTGLTREAIRDVWRGRRSPSRPPALFTREQVLAFATGKPSEAFGERYRPFDEGRFIARLPAPPYSFLDRVVGSTVEPFAMRAGVEAVAEYDVPADAWYFDAERQAAMPFAVLQEVALQACGWCAAFMGSALTSDEDMAFRNLGGEAVALALVTPGTGALSTRVKVTRVARSGGMILQHYDFETSARGVPVYRGSTYFGFFRREALADQVGIRETVPYALTPAERSRARSFDYPDTPPFPDRRLRMIDRIEAFVADGGPHGLGFVEGTLAVDPSAWFFRAHFYQDPVCPGSLGLESLLQLLKVIARERWGGGPASEFEPVGLGVPHRWLYRGQVVPADRLVTVQALVTGLDDGRRLVTADGSLSVDGRVIYQMSGFSLRLKDVG
jgi:acyl transferase domain-containing protein/3-hydroxymyristoyl/3-hydroxydecanoyl-(acyl carrier protein) dehydratase